MPAPAPIGGGGGTPVETLGGGGGGILSIDFDSDETTAFDDVPFSPMG